MDLFRMREMGGAPIPTSAEFEAAAERYDGRAGIVDQARDAMEVIQELGVGPYAHNPITPGGDAYLAAIGAPNAPDDVRPRLLAGVTLDEVETVYGDAALNASRATDTARDVRDFGGVGEARRRTANPLPPVVLSEETVEALLSTPPTEALPVNAQGEVEDAIPAYRSVQRGTQYAREFVVAADS